ncbi:MAG: class I SAM-dependent methyltransferase [Phycisphaerae bacterium]|nr:class I SAM-dependent methyltransferase [Phycisphaerae bacterium]
MSGGIKAWFKGLAFRATRPGLVPVHDKLDALRKRLEGLEDHLGYGPGAASKYASELAYWRYVTKGGGSEKDFGVPYEELFHRWQRDRLLQLSRFLSLPDEASIDRWCEDQSVVEIGAGPYPSCAAAPRWRRAVAVDPLAKGYSEEGMLPRTAGHVVYLEAPGERIPLPAGFADLLICENCLDHVGDPAAVVTEIMRLLRPGGLLWFLVDLSSYSDHMHPHPMNEVRVRALLAGFEVVREEISDHKSHPEAYGELRALLRKPMGRAGDQVGRAEVVVPAAKSSQGV